MKFNENVLKSSGDMEQTENSRVNPMTLNCDLDLRLHSKVMGYAHRLTEINIWVNLMKIVHMEWTPNSR